MAIKPQDLINWLKTIPENHEVGIDEGGLTLQEVGHPDTYLEVGGIPEDDPFLEESDS